MKKYILLLLFCAYAYVPGALAQEAGTQTLSVTPPLIQNSMDPGAVWQSYLKVVNGNTYPITVYAEVVNFEPVGEAGRGRFVPRDETDSSGYGLAHWVHINTPSVTIAPEQTSDISFFVDMPLDASPGGHYAAILVSTEPPNDAGGSFAVKTSQAVATLLFFRVAGDIREHALIREFRVEDMFTPLPQATFQLRFENKGNVHVQPRGDITITNMWGTERGVIPVNYRTHFGNVLPESIRDFSFTWASDFRFTDIGRYTARVSLTYGEENVQSAFGETHFWVLPVKTTLLTLGSAALVVWVIVYLIRAYVRRMLYLAGVGVDASDEATLHGATPKATVYRKVSAPVRKGVLDLRTELTSKRARDSVLSALWRFIVAYRLFFFFVGLVIVLFVGGVWYIEQATLNDVNYTVVENPEREE